MISQGMTVIGQAVAVSENDPSFAGFTSNTDTLTSGVVAVYGLDRSPARAGSVDSASRSAEHPA